MNKRKMLVIAGLIVWGLAVLVLAGCVPFNQPVFTYQGRLTDAGGNPVPDGTYNMTFILRRGSAVTDTAVYTQTTSVSVNDGLFDTAVGPTGVGGMLLYPEYFAEPLWLEVTVSDGVYKETLTPRQRLYGAPYAMSLAPGAVISGPCDYEGTGTYGVDSTVRIYNTSDGYALQAYSNSGDSGAPIYAENKTGLYNDPDLLLGGRTGNLHGGTGNQGDLQLQSNDDVWVALDHDGGSESYLRVSNDSEATVWRVDEDGDTWAAGTKGAFVPTEDYGQRTLYVMESPGVWFEDFGTASLVDGVAIVTIDPLFVQTVNLEEAYHVFLTPLGDCDGLYVAEKTATSFTVRELGGGTANVAFDYRIVAKRLGYEDLRMEPFVLDAGEELEAPALDLPPDADRGE